tara:strand:+ start:487 stop:696 length:210 start_codon:yes stop_codon:yes gene_type:complete
MKKATQEHNSLHTQFSIDVPLRRDERKTTNINILLNRVKLDKKKELRKKIFFLSALTSIVIFVALFAIN